MTQLRLLATMKRPNNSKCSLFIFLLHFIWFNMPPFSLLSYDIAHKQSNLITKKILYIFVRLH